MENIQAGHYNFREDPPAYGAARQAGASLAESIALESILVEVRFSTL